MDGGGVGRGGYAARMAARMTLACCTVLALALWTLLAAPSAGVAWAAGALVPAGPRSCGAAAVAATGARPAHPAARADAEPHLSLNPAHGAAGTRIAATGSGWPVGASVSLEAQARGQGVFGQPPLSATVGSDGAFTLTLAAPAGTCYFQPAVGQVIQLVAQVANGSQTASADFTYDTPAPTLSWPLAGGQVAAQAKALPVRGTSWGAGTVVTVWATTPSTQANPHDAWLPPAGVPTVVLRADAHGRIAGEVPLAPSLLPLRPGAVLGLEASATGPGYGQAITYLPGAYLVGLAQPPTLAASVQTVAQGGSLRVTGEHWWPGDSLRLLLCQGAPQPTKGPEVRCNPARSVALGTAQVDPSGHFAATVSIPAAAPAGASTLEASLSGETDDPFTATQPLRVTASVSVGAWLASTLGPAGPLVALALLALAAALAAVWWMARSRRRAAPQGAGRR